MQEMQHFRRVKSGSDRGFAITFAFVFAIIALWPLASGNPVRIWAIVLAAVFLGIGLLRPAILAPLNRGWAKLGLVLGHVVTPIVMSVVYAVAIVPSGVLLRLFGRDLLKQKLEQSADTYWVKRTEQPGSMKQQY